MKKERSGHIKKVKIVHPILPIEATMCEVNYRVNGSVRVYHKRFTSWNSKQNIKDAKKFLFQE